MNRLSLIFLFSLILVAYCGNQAVGVKGTLMCGDQPLAGATVKLWELDTFPDPDDELATVKTDSQGRFELSGSESEILSITPVLKIYHRCNNKGLFNLPKLCKRKVAYDIPKTYIVKGKSVSPSQYYNFGTMNMEAKQKDEDTECI